MVNLKVYELVPIEGVKRGSRKFLPRMMIADLPPTDGVYVLMTEQALGMAQIATMLDDWSIMTEGRDVPLAILSGMAEGKLFQLHKIGDDSDVLTSQL